MKYFVLSRHINLIQFSFQKNFIATQNIVFYIQTQDMVHNNFIK